MVSRPSAESIELHHVPSSCTVAVTITTSSPSPNYWLGLKRTYSQIVSQSFLHDDDSVLEPSLSPLDVNDQKVMSGLQK